jgi:protein-arginine kinase activator protein McsA
MLCDICKKKEAVIHIQEISSAGKKIVHMCNDCAEKQQQFDPFLQFGNLTFADVLQNIKKISSDIVKKKNVSVTIDDVHNETIELFHRLIQRLEKLTLNCEDPGTINQALKTTADFLVKLNKERENGDEEINAMLQQTLQGI